MRLNRFTTDVYPVRERPSAWLETLKQHHFRSELGNPSNGMFGTLVTGETPQGIGLKQIAASPQSIARLRKTPGEAWLAFHVAGDACLGRSAPGIELLPGDIVYGSAHADARSTAQPAAPAD